MNYLILILATLFLIGCGSSGKKAEEAADSTEAKAEASKEATKDSSKKVAASENAINCTMGGDKRTIDVVSNDQGCSVQYTKAGTSNEVASGSSGSAHCTNVAERIKGNLESAGFSCN